MWGLCRLDESQKERERERSTSLYIQLKTQTHSVHCVNVTSGKDFTFHKAEHEYLEHFNSKHRCHTSKFLFSSLNIYLQFKDIKIKNNNVNKAQL